MPLIHRGHKELFWLFFIFRLTFLFPKGFYSVSGSSLSDSSYSVSSEAAHGKPLKLWEQAPEAANSNTDILWSEDAMPLHQSAPDNSQEDPQPPEETPVSGETNALLFHA